jgi:hypothetical protein
MKKIDGMWYFENPLTSFLDPDGSLGEVPSFPGRTDTTNPLICNLPISASANLDMGFSPLSSQPLQSQMCSSGTVPAAPILDATDRILYIRCTNPLVRESDSI